MLFLRSRRVLAAIPLRPASCTASLPTPTEAFFNTVAFYATNITGLEPDVVNPPLADYQTGGNAGETTAGEFDGVMMYDYVFTL